MRFARWRLIVPLRIRSLFRGTAVDCELDEELRFHVDQQIEQNIARGMRPDEARTAALRAMGGIDQRKEECRDVRRVRIVEDLVVDLRYAIRMMRGAPGFTIVAVLSLALGIGANAAIFSLLDALLLKPLPVDDPDRLFAVRTAGTYPVFQALRERGGSLIDLFASAPETLNVEVENSLPERTSVWLVSGSYFDVLGVRPLAGRLLTGTDDRVPGAHPVAVASFGYWQRRFGRDPAVIGSTIRITGQPITIVGITAPGFFGEEVAAAPDLWVPITMWGQVVPGRNLLRSPGTAWLGFMGRLKAGVDAAQAEAVLTPLVRQVLAERLGPNMADDDRRDLERTRVRLVPARNGVSSLRSRFTGPLQILMSAVALVLLIACANIANLLLVRATTRKHEIGVRLALGMRRGRLVRQLLTESLLLAGFGGLAGVAVSWWLCEVLLRLVSGNGSRLPLAIAIDARLMLFVAGLSVTTGLLFGLAPTWQSTRTDLRTAIGSPRHSDDSRKRRFAVSPMLVISQVALSLVLVAGAGLFLRTLINLRQVHLGFAPERLFVADINPRAAGYQGDYSALCRRLLQRLRTLPGVESATLSENGTLGGRDSGTSRMRPDGFVAGPEGIPQAQYDIVGPEYFGTMGITRVAGRDFDNRDDASAGSVVAINEAMARRYFANANPVGRRMLWGVGPGQRELEIVAVVRNVKQRGPRDEPELRFYIPYFQHSSRELASVRFVVRTAADPAVVTGQFREAIRAEDRRLSIDSLDIVADLIDRALVRERLIATLCAGFGAMAVVLACIGLYGLMAHRVVRRTSEIGIRMAFGAARRSVLWMIVRQDLALVAAGMVIGVPLALAASSVTRSLLFGIAVDDATTLAAAVLALAVAGIAAGLAPAYRATRIEPAAALRHE